MNRRALALAISVVCLSLALMPRGHDRQDKVWSAALAAPLLEAVTVHGHIAAELERLSETYSVEFAKLRTTPDSEMRHARIRELLEKERTALAAAHQVLGSGRDPRLRELLLAWIQASQAMQDALDELLAPTVDPIPEAPRPVSTPQDGAEATPCMESSGHLSPSCPRKD